jgi:hypothetical protein
MLAVRRKESSLLALMNLDAPCRLAAQVAIREDENSSGGFLAGALKSMVVGMQPLTSSRCVQIGLQVRISS